MFTRAANLTHDQWVPRPLRIEIHGAVYHVISRGDHREAIFWEDAARANFLRTLGRACQKTDWQVHSLPP